MTWNPGALRNIARYSAPQPIIPGSSQFDYVKTGGDGYRRPAVGAYPSGASVGWVGLAADDGAPSTSPALILAACVLGAIGFWAASRR